MITASGLGGYFFCPFLGNRCSQVKLEMNIKKVDDKPMVIHTMKKAMLYIVKKKGEDKPIKRMLEQNRYTRYPEKYFTFVKTVSVQGGKVSKHIDGIKALPATGGKFAFEFPATDVSIEYQRGNGALDNGHVKVISEEPYLVMKATDFGRGKSKDAYDIYYTVNNFQGVVRALVEEFIPYKNKDLVRFMCEKLSEKFASGVHAGPVEMIK